MEDKNKKKRNIIIIVVAGLLLIGLGTVCLVNVLGNRDNKASGGRIESTVDVVVVATDTEEKITTESATTEEKATTEKVTTEKATTEGKATTESASGTSTKPSASTESVVSAPNTTAAPSTTQAPSTTAAPSTTQAPTTTEREKVWIPPVTEQVWVIDKEAYTETIPVIEETEAVRCHGCQQLFTSADEFWSHVDAVVEDECLGGWSSATMIVEVGTTEVYHEEEGHWETITIKEGYWE